MALLLYFIYFFAVDVTLTKKCDENDLEEFTGFVSNGSHFHWFCYCITKQMEIIIRVMGFCCCCCCTCKIVFRWFVNSRKRKTIFVLYIFFRIIILLQFLFLYISRNARNCDFRYISFGLMGHVWYTSNKALQMQHNYHCLLQHTEMFEIILESGKFYNRKRNSKTTKMKVKLLFRVQQNVYKV